MLFAFAALIAGLILLVWGAERAVQGAATLAARSGASPLLVGLVLPGLGSALPELVVALGAAASGHPALALGSAWGSNIVSMSLVLGTALWLAPLSLRSQLLRQELPLMAVATLLTAALVVDGVLSRWDALGLLAGFFALALWSWRQFRRSADDELAREAQAQLRRLPGSVAGAGLQALTGCLALAGGTVLLVGGAIKVAIWLGVSDLTLGLSVLALGTTLPELAACVVAARKGEDDLALGHVLGAGLVNTLAVAGLAGLIEPLDLPAQALWRDLLVMAALALGLLLMARGVAQGTPVRLGRRTGQALVAIYLLHTLALLLTSGVG